MKNYFYRLLAKYCELFFCQESVIADVNPVNTRLHTIFQKKGYRIDQIFDVGTLNTKVYDIFICNGNLHYEKDIQTLLLRLSQYCKADSRIIVCFYSALWRPFIKLAQVLKMSQSPKKNHWISPEDITNFARLSDLELVYSQQRILFPFYVPVISHVCNTIVSPLPILNWFNLLNVVVLRPLNTKSFNSKPSVSTVVAARNESGNIENIIKRLPKMGEDDEIILVEGHSSDDTWQKMKWVKQKYPLKNIRIVQQQGKGKGDAVREGFQIAQKDILMILDADLTVPPEDLPKFYQAILQNKGEFINGSRLVYSMEDQAMKFLNILGNKFFAFAFSYILNQPLKDTLCGTKVLSRKNYQKIAANRDYFGNFDPFGDFDLLFGAAKLGLKIIEVPIHYKARTYGSTNIQRWKHGLILLRMLCFASKKIKFL